MNLIAIIVYDRYDNIQHWLHCLRMCNITNYVIINNGPEPIEGAINRPNIGFDIGAFQDVAMNRLPGFPEYDNLLWITDDVFPMALDFDKPFWEALANGAEIACMKISPYVRQHVRTTGFAMRRAEIERLTFPADPITTKEQCYEFEHRASGHLLEQIGQMGKVAVQVAPDESSPLYDTGYGRRLKERWAEHVMVFGEAGQEHPAVPTIAPVEPALSKIETTQPLISIICPAYNSFPYIISSLLAQTYTNWELHLVHDGPNETGLASQVAAFDDARIIYSETTVRSKNWGHSIRSEWLQKVKGDYVVITNQDNQHPPPFLEKLLSGFKPDTVATYCSEMVHSYKNWNIIPCSLRRGYIDCAGVMIRASVAKEVGWVDVTSHSADWFFFERIIRAKGAGKWVRVNGCLLVHNVLIISLALISLINYCNAI